MYNRKLEINLCCASQASTSSECVTAMSLVCCNHNIFNFIRILILLNSEHVERFPTIESKTFESWVWRANHCTIVPIK